MKLEKISKTWYFLFGVVLAYLVVLIFDINLFFELLRALYGLVLKILPLMLIIFVVMVIVNYYVTVEFVVKHLKESGFRKWVFVIVGGILSTGPIYMWYPMLADLKKKGLTDGLIACFLYNRAIKIPLMPVAIFYFGVKYVVILTIVMVLVSVVQGILIDKIMDDKK